MGNEKPFDVTYKILLIGDSGVGKTALIKSLMGYGFNSNHNTTIGFDFVKKIFEVDGARVQLEIWDTAGQERFRTITKFQYRGTKGLMLVYDVTDKNSFNTLDYWLDSVDKEIDQDSTEPTPVFLLANKRDLEVQRAVTYEAGRKMAEEHFVHGFLETSAKEGFNVCSAFRQLALAVTEINNSKLMDAYLKPDERQEKYESRFQSFTLEAAPPSDGKKGINLILCFPGRRDRKKKKGSHTCCATG